jgi:hypothetical protein
LIGLGVQARFPLPLFAGVCKKAATLLIESAMQKDDDTAAAARLTATHFSSFSLARCPSRRAA